MEIIYSEYKRKFIEKFGIVKFEKLYKKVEESNALVKLIGLSVQKGFPPTATDFEFSVNSILYIATKFDTNIVAMAALVELKFWNEKVNNRYCLVSDSHLRTISERIVSKWL